MKAAFFTTYARGAAFVLCAFVFAIALFSTHAASAQKPAKYPNVKVGFVSGGGLVLFYKGFDTGLVLNESYNLYSDTGWVAEITVQKKEDNFTTARIVSGYIPSEYTGRYLASVPLKSAVETTVTVAPQPVEDVATTAVPDEEPEQPEVKKPPKQKPEPVRQASIENDRAADAGANNPAEPRRKRISYSMLVRFDAHSSNDYPDANIATIVSATRRANTSLTTLYVIGNTDISNRIPDYVGAGLNFTYFFTPLFNYSLGYNYQARDDVADDPDFKTRYDLVNASISRSVLPAAYKNTVLTGTVSYSTKANFRDNRSYSGNIQFTKKLKDDKRFSLSFKRLWQFAADGFRQSIDQYGSDFSFKMSDKRITLGYYYLDRNNIFGRTSVDDDINFRFTVYSSGK